jgi:Mg2+ and Co2+ transporter CorA
MLNVYRDTGSFLTSPSTDLPGEIIWMDLVNPTDEEKSFVQARARVRIPTKEALSEIENSSRLMAEGGTIYMSTSATRKASVEKGVNRGLNALGRLPVNAVRGSDPLRLYQQRRNWSAVPLTCEVVLAPPDPVFGT